MTHLLLIFSIACIASISTSVLATGLPPTKVVIVDKKTNSLKIAEYTESGYNVLKTYRTTVGQVLGDKEEEGDLKTPEGIYFFTSKLKPPAIKPKFGVMAFYMNYPNGWDTIAGRTGYDIMLHATNEPERLSKDFDSEGCIVVKNEELLEIEPHLRLNITPILVFSEFKDEYMYPAKDVRLKTLFQSWVNSWEQRNLDTYVDFYHTRFKAQGMDKAAWKSYKGGLNKRYETIQIGPENVRYFKHPKYSLMMFVQNYRSKLKGGKQMGHVSRGTKILIVADDAGTPKIIEERFTQAVY